MKIREVLNLKKFYEVKCYKCGHLQFALPSISMTYHQVNRGSSHCIKCKIHLALKINNDNSKMFSQEYKKRTLGNDALPEACYKKVIQPEIKKAN